MIQGVKEHGAHLHSAATAAAAQKTAAATTTTMARRRRASAKLIGIKFIRLRGGRRARPTARVDNV